MSNPDSGSSKGSVKTLAIRLEPDLHAQLSLIAQLRGSTITEEIRTAIEARIALAKATPELAAQSQNALDDIEREAEARRGAIATLFGTAEADSETPDSGTTAPRGSRSQPGSRSEVSG